VAQRLSAQTTRTAETRVPLVAGSRPLAARWIALLLSLATVAAYLPTLRSGFTQFDDPTYITANPQVQTGLSWSGVFWAFSTLHASNWHPLTWLSHMLDCQLFGLNPAGHHATGILLHALNAALLFLLLQKATGLRWRSLMVAALFAFHPLNVETVAWVSERKSLLSMLFSLVTIGLYGWYARAPHWRRYVAVAAAFALALLAKPMAVTLPLVLLLLDYWPLCRVTGSTNKETEDGRTGCSPSKLIGEKMPLFAMSAASSLVTIVAQKTGGAVRDLHAVPFSMRMENAAVAIVTYMRRMLWPKDLAYFYPLRLSDLALWKVSLAALLLLAISVLVYRFRGRRHLVFGWVFFLVTLLPVIGIVQVGAQSTADRYTYVPLIGLFVAILWEISGLAAAMRISQPLQASAAILLLAFLANSARINQGYWRSGLTLFQHAHQVVHPPDLQIETNLAAALTDADRYAEALVYFRNAKSIAPKSFTAHYNYGYTLAHLGDQTSAAAAFEQALRFATTPEENALAWKSLGIADLNMGKYRQAADAFSALLSIRPTDAEGMFLRGQASFLLLDYNAASRDLLRAAQANPTPGRYLMAGRALEKSGQIQPAMECYRWELKTDPNSREARDRIRALQDER